MSVQIGRRSLELELFALEWKPGWLEKLWKRKELSQLPVWQRRVWILWAEV